MLHLPGQRALVIPGDGVQIAQRRTRTAAAGFNPADYGTCVGWFDPTDLATLFTDSAHTVAVASDADPVGAWLNKGTLGGYATQGTSGSKPTYKSAIQNGLAIIRFDATDDFLDADGVAQSSRDFSIVAVCYKSALATNTPLFSMGSGIVEVMYPFDNGLGNFPRWYLGDNYGFGSGADRSGAFRVFEFNAVSSTSHKVYYNGALLGTETSSHSGSQTVARIGGLYSGGQPFGGDIGDLMVFSPALDATGRANLYTALQTRWGI